MFIQINSTSLIICGNFLFTKISHLACERYLFTYIGGPTLECVIRLLVVSDSSQIRVQRLVSGSITLESDIWSGLNHIRLQHFHMIEHTKCCSLMWVNPRPNVALLCKSTGNQMTLSNVGPPILLGPYRLRLSEPGILIKKTFKILIQPLRLSLVECKVCKNADCIGDSLQIIENACFDSLQ